VHSGGFPPSILIRRFGEASIPRLVVEVGFDIEGIRVPLRVAGSSSVPPGLIGHRFQNPCDGMRNARLKREDAFSHAMIIVISAMESSS
jgi:hypothetical protein